MSRLGAGATTQRPVAITPRPAATLAEAIPHRVVGSAAVTQHPPLAATTRLLVAAVAAITPAVEVADAAAAEATAVAVKFSLTHSAS